MKISEGMYVRTEKGEIKKIFQYDEQEDNLIWCTLNCHATIKSSIVKASYNIIDLIEEGDYVNGYPVVDFDVTYFNGIDRREEPKRIGVIVEKNMGFSKTYFKNEDIKTILTKEQYENNCYKVEE